MSWVALTDHNPTAAERGRPRTNTAIFSARHCAACGVCFPDSPRTWAGNNKRVVQAGGSTAPILGCLGIRRYGSDLSTRSSVQHTRAANRHRGARYANQTSCRTSSRLTLQTRANRPQRDVHRSHSDRIQTPPNRHTLRAAPRRLVQTRQDGHLFLGQAEVKELLRGRNGKPHTQNQTQRNTALSQTAPQLVDDDRLGDKWK